MDENPVVVTRYGYGDDIASKSKSRGRKWAVKFLTTGPAAVVKDVATVSLISIQTVEMW